MTSLLATGGRVILSLRHGPIPAGRRMFPVSAEETIDLAQRHGLDTVHHTQREDVHARPDVSWSCLGFRADAHGARNG